MVARLPVIEGAMLGAYAVGAAGSRADKKVPGGAGFRRAPWPISDRPVPTQGNEAHTDMDRKILPHVSISSQSGIAIAWLSRRPFCSPRPASAPPPSRTRPAHRGLGRDHS